LQTYLKITCFIANALSHWGDLCRPEELKYNRTYQLLVYSDDNFLVNNIYATKKNKAALLLTNKEVHIEVTNTRTEKILTSHYQNEGQNLNILTGNKSFGNVASSNIKEQH